MGRPVYIPYKQCLQFKLCVRFLLYPQLVRRSRIFEGMLQHILTSFVARVQLNSQHEREQPPAMQAAPQFEPEENAELVNAPSPLEDEDEAIYSIMVKGMALVSRSHVCKMGA